MGYGGQGNRLTQSTVKHNGEGAIPQGWEASSVSTALDWKTREPELDPQNCGGWQTATQPISTHLTITASLWIFL